MIYTINPDKIQVFRDQADNFVPDPKKDNAGELSEQAEEAILALKDIEKQAQDALAAIKTRIEQQGKERMGDSFKAIAGNKVTVGYQFAGGQSEFEATAELSAINPDFINTSTKIDPTAIRKYRKEYDELPPGIGLAERSKSVVLRFAKEKKDD